MERTSLIHEFAESFKKIRKKNHIEFIQLFDEYIPFNEYQVLKVLHEKSPLKVSEIAEILDVSNSHVTTTSEKLVQKELVDRVRSTHDRRIVYLSITDEGKTLVRKMKTLIYDYFEEKLEDISNEELQMAINIFTKILNK